MLEYLWEKGIWIRQMRLTITMQNINKLQPIVRDFETKRATLLFILGLLIVPFVLYPISDWIQHSSETLEKIAENIYTASI